MWRLTISVVVGVLLSIPAPADAAELKVGAGAAEMDALAVIGRSVGVEDNAALKELERDFADALGTSSLFAPWQEQGAWLFPKYRGFLEKGWREGPF